MLFKRKKTHLFKQKNNALRILHIMLPRLIHIIKMNYKRIRNKKIKVWQKLFDLCTHIISLWIYWYLLTYYQWYILTAQRYVIPICYESYLLQSLYSRWHDHSFLRYSNTQTDSLLHTLDKDTRWHNSPPENLCRMLCI